MSKDSIEDALTLVSTSYWKSLERTAMYLRTLAITFALIAFLSACGNQAANTGSNSDDAPDTGASEKKTPETLPPGEQETAKGTPVNGDQVKPFSKTLELQGITFVVECENSSSINKVKITPKGLGGSNDPIEEEADGTVFGAEVADLDANGSPEVYVYVTSAGSGSYGSLIAYAVNNKKSMSMINLPEIAEGSEEAKGYMGHDEFAVVENSLIRRFPVYKEGDANAKPTGGTRQIQYKLKMGEAAWQLVVDKVVNF